MVVVVALTHTSPDPAAGRSGADDEALRRLRLVPPPVVGAASPTTARRFAKACWGLLRRTFTRRDRPLTIMDVLAPEPIGPDRHVRGAMKVR